MALLEIRNLSVRYPDGTLGIRAFTLDVDDGEIVLLAGESGSGKSTVLRAVSGIVPELIKADVEGKVVFKGKDVSRLGIAERALLGIGIVVQDFRNQVLMDRVKDEIRFGLENIGAENIEERVAEAAELLKLSQVLNRRVDELSGGYVQRVVIASMIAMKHKLLLLDEPFSQLDSESCLALKNILKRLRDAGVSVIVAEHRIRYVVDVADRAVLVKRGMKVFEGDSKELERVCEKLGVKVRVRPVPFRSRQQLGFSDPAIELDGVYAGYRKGSPVLKNVSMRVPKGSVVSIMGPNGSGKTTLLLTILGVVRVERGTVRVLGKNPRKLVFGRDFGFVPQNPDTILLNRSVFEEIAESLRRVKKRVTPEEVRKCAERLGIGHLLDKHPQSLSVGERFRVALALAVAPRPKLLLLDEPTTGQDLANIELMLKVIDELRRDGSTIVLVTHDEEVAYAVSDYILELDEGKVRSFRRC